MCSGFRVDLPRAQSETEAAEENMTRKMPKGPTTLTMRNLEYWNVLEPW